MEIHRHPSPNFGPRRDGLTPRYVVLHYTAMDSTSAAIARLCDPQHQVSAHYIVCRGGAVTQLVAEGQRAWHAGAGEWQGHRDMNSRSIGIELDNDGQGPFAEAQMRSLETLLGRILTAWTIPPAHVIGHSDMAPGRKHDPGAHFDWPRLEAAGLAAPTACTAPEGRAMQDFLGLARAAGYTAPVAPDAILSSVRLRHRPTGTGPLCDADFRALLRT